MDPTEQSEEILGKLFDKSDDLRLSKEVVFLVGPADEMEKFTGADLIELLRSNDFVRIFSESDEVEEIDEISVPDLNRSVFLNLLR